jgi:hypothetical protein
VTTLNLIKLVVGVETVQELETYGRQLVAQSGVWTVRTRSTPVRAAELIDGGSLYRVIKGVVVCRQRILAIETVGAGRESRCAITVEPALIPVTPTPKRPFQGWRYLKAEEAPADLDAGSAAVDAPVSLVLKLRELGAW